MRLVDADKLKETLLKNRYTTRHNQIFRYIDEQPTVSEHEIVDCMEVIGNIFDNPELLEVKAVEKHTAKKPIGIDRCTCPSCGTYNETINKRRNTVVCDTVYCWHCGQAIECRRDIDLE